MGKKKGDAWDITVLMKYGRRKRINIRIRIMKSNEAKKKTLKQKRDVVTKGIEILRRLARTKDMREKQQENVNRKNNETLLRLTVKHNI